jgi:hypothetical protein
VLGNRLLVQLVGQHLDVLVVHVGTQLEVTVIQLLKSRPLLLLTYLHQILYILDKVQHLLVVLVVVVGDNRDTVLQLIKVRVGRVVNQKDVLQISVFEHS